MFFISMFEDILPASAWIGAVDGLRKPFLTIEKIKRGEEIVPEHRFENISRYVINGLPYIVESID